MRNSPEFVAAVQAAQNLAKCERNDQDVLTMLLDAWRDKRLALIAVMDREHERAMDRLHSANEQDRTAEFRAHTLDVAYRKKRDAFERMRGQHGAVTALREVLL